MNTRRKRIVVALGSMAFVCASAVANDFDRGHNRSSYDNGTYYNGMYSRTNGTFIPPAQPTAGGNSAEPDRTGDARYALYAAPHDDRFTPSPRTGAPLPSAGGNPGEPDKTGMDRHGRHMSRSMDSSAAYEGTASTDTTPAMRAEAPRSNSWRHRDRVSRFHSDRTYDRTAGFGYYPHGAAVGDPFPTAGGNSAEPERSGRFS